MERSLVFQSELCGFVFLLLFHGVFGLWNALGMVFSDFAGV